MAPSSAIRWAATATLPIMARAGGVGPGPSAAIDRSWNSAVSRQEAARDISRTTRPRGPNGTAAPQSTAMDAVFTRKRHVSAPRCNRTAALPKRIVARGESWLMKARPTRGTHSPHIHVSKSGESKGLSGSSRRHQAHSVVNPNQASAPFLARRRTRWQHGSARPQPAASWRPVAQRGPTPWQPGYPGPERGQPSQIIGWPKRWRMAWRGRFAESALSGRPA